MKREQHVPTEENRERIYHMAIAGCSQATMGKVLGISKETVAKRYRDVLDATKGKCLDRTVAALMVQVDKGNMEAIKILLRRYDEERIWRDAPQEVTVTHRLQAMSDTELDAEINRLRTIEGEATVVTAKQITDV